MTGAGAADTAQSGSLRPLPVTVHTTREPAATWPCSRAWSSPATLAAEASSPNTASLAASSRYASKICRSVTESMSPPDSSRAASASSHDAGLPIRIAVAMVSGARTGSPRTIGAAPLAWKPSIRGVRVARPAAAYCL